MPALGSVLEEARPAAGPAAGQATGPAAGRASGPEARVAGPARVQVRLLGGFQVTVDGRNLPPRHWARRHSAALVKLLALAPGRSLHREQVIDALWPDLDVDHAAPRLHKAAHYAREALGHRDAVVLTADTVRLFPGDDVDIDRARFQEHAESAVADGSVAAATAALAVYGGELLPHDLYEPWTEQPRLHLTRLHTELLHQAEDWHQVLAADPTNEPAHLALAQRYLERGDRPAALRQLDELDRILQLEFGLEPSQRALALRQRIETADATVAVDRPCCPDTSPSPGAAGHKSSPERTYATTRPAAAA
jgi:DNA-binding SARP family transcriptional activator